jgi:hypothetical protein
VKYQTLFPGYSPSTYGWGRYIVKVSNTVNCCALSKIIQNFPQFARPGCQILHLAGHFYLSQQQQSEKKLFVYDTTVISHLAPIREFYLLEYNCRPISTAIAKSSISPVTLRTVSPIPFFNCLRSPAQRLVCHSVGVEHCIPRTSAGRKKPSTLPM